MAPQIFVKQKGAVVMIVARRIYEKPSNKKTFRILVERLWPRGLSRARARVDLWLKEIAPSPLLRKWFAHDPAKWGEFKRRYKRELGQKKDLLKEVKLLEKEKKNIELVYSARDQEFNNAIVLEELLKK